MFFVSNGLQPFRGGGGVMCCDVMCYDVMRTVAGWDEVMRSKRLVTGDVRKRKVVRVATRHVMWCDVVSCHVKSFDVTDVILSPLLACHVMWRDVFAMSCHVMQCDVRCCHVISRKAMPWNLMWRKGVGWDVHDAAVRGHVLSDATWIVSCGDLKHDIPRVTNTASATKESMEGWLNFNKKRPVPFAHNRWMTLGSEWWRTAHLVKASPHWNFRH